MSALSEFELNQKFITINGNSYYEDGNISNGAATLAALKGLTAPRCLDIGAYKGWWSQYVLKEHSDAHITLFEPNPIVFEELQTIMKPYAGCECLPYAASNQNEILDFCLQASDSKIISAPTSQSVKVVCKDIAQLFIDIDNFDAVKIDTEGYDLKVLISLMPWIISRKIRFVVTEFTPWWYNTNETNYMENIISVFQPIFENYHCIYLCSRSSDYLIGPITENDFFEVVDFLHSYKLQTDICFSTVDFQSKNITIMPWSQYYKGLYERRIAY